MFALNLPKTNQLSNVVQMNKSPDNWLQLKLYTTVYDPIYILVYESRGNCMALAVLGIAGIGREK